MVKLLIVGVALCALTTVAGAAGAPQMSVSCDVNHTCDVAVHPNGHPNELVLGVEAAHLWKWEPLDVPGGWGVRLWFMFPRCGGQYSWLRLYELIPDGGQRVIALADAGEGSPVLAERELWDFCAFVPAVFK